MGGLLFKAISKTGSEKLTPSITNFFDFKMKDIKGNTVNFADFKGKTKLFMIVNVACKCGFTGDHYTQLVEIYNKYNNKGLEIFGFPCNQFMSQESGTEEDI
jgi:glutathione peroxidase